MRSRAHALAAGFAATALTLSPIALPAWGQGAAPAGDGAAIYSSAGCSGCHGANGEGGLGPSFPGNANLADAAIVASQIINGGGEMPGFGDTLDDAAIAAVATYIRGTWGNAFPPVTAEEVAAARAASAPAAPAAPAP